MRRKSLGRCVTFVQKITAFFIAWVDSVLIACVQCVAKISWALCRCVSVVQNITTFFIAWVDLVLIGVKNTPLLQKSVTPHPSLSHILNLNFLPKVYVTKSKMLVSLVAWLLSGGSGCVTHGFLSFSFGFSVFLKSNIVEDR